MLKTNSKVLMIARIECFVFDMLKCERKYKVKIICFLLNFALLLQKP